jgi:hypothetical protein
MESDYVVCFNCGKARETSPNEVIEPPTELDETEHHWSEPNPLDRAIARATTGGRSELLRAEDNDDWQWFEVRVTDRDVEGTSESIAAAVRREGFSFVGLGSDPGSMRFNRQKSAPQV